MVIGCFLNIEVIPGRSIHIVYELVHAGNQIVIIANKFIFLRMLILPRNVLGIGNYTFCNRIVSYIYLAVAIYIALDCYNNFAVCFKLVGITSSGNREYSSGKNH